LEDATIQASHWSLHYERRRPSVDLAS